MASRHYWKKSTKSEMFIFLRRFKVTLDRANKIAEINLSISQHAPQFRRRQELPQRADYVMIFHRGNILIFLWNSWCWALSQEMLQSQAADVICSGNPSTGVQLIAELLLRASCLAEATGLWGSLLAMLCSFFKWYFKRSIILSPLSLFPPYQLYGA